MERSVLGPIAGTGFSDWPISYRRTGAVLQRRWTGKWVFPGRRDPSTAPRSKPFPMPPMPVKSSGILFEKGARALGLNPQPAPLAILSRPFNGRPSCAHCGFCLGFGCEVKAKSSTLVSMIPFAEASGHCEIRALSTVSRIETNDRGRVSEVVYFDAQWCRTGAKSQGGYCLRQRRRDAQVVADVLIRSVIRTGWPTVPAWSEST